MRPSQKLAISLLFATVLFGAFSFLAFSGLFPYIETQFFSPRVVKELVNSAKTGEQVILSYKKRTLSGLELLLRENYFTQVFNPTQSSTDVSNQFNSVRLFLKGFRGKASLRIVGKDYRKIHFSTEEADLLKLTDNSVSFLDYSPGSNWPDSKVFTPLSGVQGDVVSRPEGVRLYQIPLVDPVTQQVRGFGLLSVSVEDEGYELFQQGIIPDWSFYKVWSSDLAYISYSDILTPEVLEEASKVLAQSQGSAIRYLTKDKMRLVLIKDNDGAKGWAAIAPASLLELSNILKVIFLFSIFTLSFLPIFIILNFRAEPEIVWTKKIKKMQIQILTGFLDQNNLGPKDVPRALINSSAQIKDQLRKVIGRTDRTTAPLVDKLIDQSWDEILKILGVQAQSPPVSSTSDIERIEKLLREALARGALSVSPGDIATKEKPKDLGEPGELLEELEDTDEPEELLEELEDTDEAEELLEELEDTDEPEELLEELEDTDEPEELLEELEDTDEPEEQLEELEDTDEAEETFEELNDLEETGEDPIYSDIQELPLLVNTEEELELLSPVDDHSGSGSILEPLVGGQDFYLYPGLGVGKKTLDGDLRSIGGAELVPLEDEEKIDPLPRIKSFTMDEIGAYYKNMGQNLLLEDEGVYSISPEIFQNVQKPKDQEFSQLVDEVTRKKVGPQAFLLEEEESIQTQKVWSWGPLGFDLDRLLQGYRSGDLGLFKALVDLSGLFETVGIAIIEEIDDDFRASFSVGFSDAGKKKLIFPKSGPFSQSVYIPSGLHILDGRFQDSLVRKVLDPKDLKFISSLVVAPLRFRSESAFLLLGMKSYPNEILEKMAPVQNIHLVK